MQDILYQYEINPTTWVYLSSLLALVVFFKFGRLLSLRNLDLIALLALAPGLLMVSQGQQMRMDAPGIAAVVQTAAEEWGYVWLFAVGMFFLVRLLCDPLMIRRPLLEPNLSAGGLGFLALCLFVFLMANVVTAELDRPPPAAAAAESDRPTTDKRAPPEAAEQPSPQVSAAGLPADKNKVDGSLGNPSSDGGSSGQSDMQGGGKADAEGAPQDDEEGAVAGSRPGFLILDWFPRIPSQAFGVEGSQARRVNDISTRTLLVLCHFALAAGLVFIGARYFDNAWTGMAMVTLYLMLPYTAQMVGRVDHVVPAALLVWTLALYNRPLAAGVLMGLNIGLIYYAGFLLPLWCSFYWRRGLLKFAVGIAISMGGLFIIVAVFALDQFGMFLGHFAEMFELSLPTAEGFWVIHSAFFRLPVAIVFCCLCAALAFVPPQKNLGTLMACSAAVMLGTQFWYAHGGLLYVNWYLPPLLLTVFRPNLEHRAALASFGNGRRVSRRRAAGPQAA